MLIVHPTDLNAASEGAFDHALRLGVAARGRLALVHAHAWGQAAPDLDDFPQVRQTLARWRLLPPGAPTAAVAERLGLLVSKAEITASNPEGGLARLLKDEQAAMVVLGTRALDGLQRLLQGSFSERLAREARLPALFVPNAATGFVGRDDGAVRLRSLLVPVAENPAASGALASALRLAALLGQEPELHLLHIGPPGSMPPLQLHGRPAQQIVRPGPVVDAIVEVADDVEADLIVMATEGHKSFLDALRGSTTEAVLRRARRALLAVPAGAEEEEEEA